jgi:hypothetical protein
LPTAIHQAFRGLHFSRYKRFNAKVSLDQWPFEVLKPIPEIDKEMQDLRVYPFPDLNGLCAVLQLVTGWENTKIPRNTDLLISDIPGVKTYLKGLSKQCGYADCFVLGSSNTNVGGSNMFKRCDRKEFFRRLAIVVGDILALFLFTCPDGLRIQLEISQHSFHKNILKGTIEEILTTREHKGYCEVSSLLE